MHCDLIAPQQCQMRPYNFSDRTIGSFRRPATPAFGIARPVTLFSLTPTIGFCPSLFKPDLPALQPEATAHSSTVDTAVFQLTVVLDDGHWACNGFTASTVPATGLRAVGLR